MALTVESCLAQHMGDREEQQDSVALYPHPSMPGTFLAVLADGMGGHSGGALASQQVLLKARQNLETFSPSEETPEDFLRGILKEAHLVIKLTRFTSEQDPHSTGVLLLVHDNAAYWAHCGDSRIYHYRGINLANRSVDHSLVAEMKRRGQLDEAGTRRHPQRNVLLSCLGNASDPQISVGRQQPLMEGDSFILCSDGLWGYLRDEEMGAVLGTQSARRSAQIFVDRARERAKGNGDNLSMAIIRVVARQERGTEAPRPGEAPVGAP